MGHINLKGGDLMFILFGIATFQMNCVLDEGGKGIGELEPLVRAAELNRESSMFKQ